MAVRRGAAPASVECRCCRRSLAQAPEWVSTSSASTTRPRRSTCANGWRSPATRVGHGAGGAARAAVGARGGAAVHLQPHRALRRDARRRRGAGALAGDALGTRGRGPACLPLPAPRRRCRAPPVPRGHRAGLAGAGRAADPRPGEGRLGDGARGRHAGPAARPPVPARLRHRQARAHRHPHRREPGVGGVDRGAPGAGVVRRARPVHRAADRRGRNHRTRRAPPRASGHAAPAGRQPHPRARAGRWPSATAATRSRWTISIATSPRPTS